MFDQCAACPHNRNERKPESMMTPDKAHTAAVMLLTGSPKQTKEAVAWLQGKLDAQAFYCEKRHQCKWQGFALHQGLGWGKIPDKNNAWRVWHERECGGRLIELFLRVELEEVHSNEA